MEEDEQQVTVEDYIRLAIWFIFGIVVGYLAITMAFKR